VQDARGREIRKFKLTTNINDSIPTLQWDEIEGFSNRALFAEKTWKWSPKAWSLPNEAGLFLKDLGRAGLSFFKALERLYLKSAQNQKILRNRDVRVPWVAEYLDAGKPDWLVAHSRSPKLHGVLPLVLRPDLLPSKDGFALTEWDSVPGGIGLTDHLGQIYLKENSPSMAKAFGEALVWQAGELGRSAQFAILVSDESATYRPEMEWLADQLEKFGIQVQVGNPNEVVFSDDKAFLNNICLDVVYRFWELFDDEVSQMPKFARCVEAGNLVVTPGMRPFLEEKLSLALLHHPRLQRYWEENLSESELKLLMGAIPKTWIIDPSPVPPGAFLDSPEVSGAQLSSWTELGDASKKERSLVLKASGFDETAWGARSVVVGEDVSAEEWSGSVNVVIEKYPNPISILQEFKKPVVMQHPVYEDSGEIEVTKGRLRLSPYYFVCGGNPLLSGALATFCPADKKIIHGMKDGALLPCLIDL